MVCCSRRAFIAGMTAAAGSLAVGTRALQAAPAKVTISKGTDFVTLGNSKIRTTVLGVGTGTRGGREQREIGMDKFTKLIRHAFERGVRYIDTADAYMTHIYIQNAIAGLPRDELFIQTKTRAKHPQVAIADIERFRRELRVDYLDTVLMHCMQVGGWPTDMRPVHDVLLDAKQKGRIRAVGVSCHGFDPLVSSVHCSELDVHLVRINPFEMKMDDTPEKVSAQMKAMYEQGRGVIGMKVYGETGYDSPEKRLEALKYVLGLGCVHCFTIGFSSPQQIDETLDLIEKAATELAAA